VADGRAVYQRDPRRLLVYVSETTVYVNGRPVVIPDHTYLRGLGPRVVA